jgi:hypothetical protein
MHCLIGQIVVIAALVGGQTQAAPKSGVEPPRQEKSARVPPKVEEYFSRCRELRQQLIDECRASIAAAEKKLEFVRRARINRRRGQTVNPKTGAMTFGDKEAKQGALEEARRTLESCQARLKGLDLAPGGAAMQGHPRVGLVGDLPDSWAKIMQIWGPKRMLVDVVWSTSMVSRSTANVAAVVGSRAAYEALAPSQIHTEYQRFLVDGVSTAGKADGQMVRLMGPFEISGTETYRTVLGGPSTVMVIRPLHIAPYREHLNLPRALPTPPPIPRP